MHNKYISAVCCWWNTTFDWWNNAFSESRCYTERKWGRYHRSVKYSWYSIEYIFLYSIMVFLNWHIFFVNLERFIRLIVICYNNKRPCYAILILIHIRVEGCYDDESGITDSSICVGTTNTTCDVIPFSIYESNTFIIPHKNELSDGSVYFVLAKACIFVKYNSILK